MLPLPVLRQEEHNHRVKLKAAGQHGKAVPPFYKGRKTAEVSAWAQNAASRSYVSYHTQGGRKGSKDIQITGTTYQCCYSNQEKIKCHKGCYSKNYVLSAHPVIETDRKNSVGVQHPFCFITNLLKKYSPADYLYATAC